MDKRSAATTAIESAIERIEPGEPFIIGDLKSQHATSTVRRVLSAMVKRNLLRRILPGVYMRPETSPYVQSEIPPQIPRVIAAISRRTGAKFQIQGADAARGHALTTQMAMGYVFETSGATRTLQIGRTTVLLRHVSQRRLHLVGHPAGSALSALWWLGKNAITAADIARIERTLSAEHFADLLAARTVMPRWLVAALEEYLSQAGQGVSPKNLPPRKSDEQQR